MNLIVLDELRDIRFGRNTHKLFEIFQSRLFVSYFHDSGVPCIAGFEVKNIDFDELYLVPF